MNIIGSTKGSTVPAWVTRIVVDVCDLRYRSYPRIVWRNSKAFGKRGRVSGHCWCGVNSRIVLTAGVDTTRVEQKLIVLHELAHWIDQNLSGHGDGWARIYVDLLRQYNMPLRSQWVQRYNSVKRVLRQERRAKALQTP